MNELFRVDSLDEITYDHFEMACVAAMSQSPESIGLLGVPCSDDYVLYEGKGESYVDVRNWSNMLSLHVVSKSGTWLCSDHIEGMGIDGTIKEAYRRFEVVKPFINKNCQKAFAPMELAEGTTTRWLEYTEDVMKRVREYVKETEKD